MANYVIRKSQKPFTVKVTPIKSDGSVSEVQSGSVDYSASDESIFKIVEDPDNEDQAVVTLTGNLGKSSVKVSGDADLGDGVTTISTEDTFEVIADEEATGFQMNYEGLEPVTQ